MTRPKAQAPTGGYRLLLQEGSGDAARLAHIVYVGAEGRVTTQLTVDTIHARGAADLPILGLVSAAQVLVFAAGLPGGLVAALRILRSEHVKAGLTPPPLRALSLGTTTQEPML
jgi:hypothetical protein